MRVVIGHPHRQRRAHPCEAVHHEADHGAIAYADKRAGVDRIEEAAGLPGRQHRCLAGFHNVAGTPYRAGRVEGHDLANHEPVEQHPDGRQVLLDRRRRVDLGELLDVRGHHHRLDLLKRQALGLAPIGKPVGGRQVRQARVRVSDGGGEKFPKPSFGFVGAREQHRGDPARDPGGYHRRAFDGD